MFTLLSLISTLTFRLIDPCITRFDACPVRHLHHIEHDNSEI